LNLFPLSEMIEIFKKKFPQVDEGFIIHSLTSFDDAEREQDPICLLPKTWNEIKTQLEKTVIDYTNRFL